MDVMNFGRLAAETAGSTAEGGAEALRIAMIGAISAVVNSDAGRFSMSRKTSRGLSNFLAGSRLSGGLAECCGDVAVYGERLAEALADPDFVVPESFAKHGGEDLFRGQVRAVVLSAADSIGAIAATDWIRWFVEGREPVSGSGQFASWRRGRFFCSPFPPPSDPGRGPELREAVPIGAEGGPETEGPIACVPGTPKEAFSVLFGSGPAAFSLPLGDRLIVAGEAREAAESLGAFWRASREVGRTDA